MRHAAALLLALGIAGTALAGAGILININRRRHRY